MLIRERGKLTLTRIANTLNLSARVASLSRVESQIFLKNVKTVMARLMSQARPLDAARKSDSLWGTAREEPRAAGSYPLPRN